MRRRKAGTRVMAARTLRDFCVDEILWVLNLSIAELHDSNMQHSSLRRERDRDFLAQSRGAR